MSWYKEPRDQTAHAIAAFSILSLVLHSHSLASYAAAGFCLGLIREITEEGQPVTLSKIWNAICGSKLDLTFWTLGGAAAYILGA
jgi:hypothetical protein